MHNSQDSIKASTSNDNIESFYNPPAWSQGHISLDDAVFLDKIVQETKPEEIIEVGVASGCSSAVLLRAMAALGESRVLHSYDLVDYCYFAPERHVGAAVDDLAPQFREQWLLHAGCTAIDAGAGLNGHNIKLAFIDADHRHPWATLDLWALIPALAPDSWIALHDVTLARNSEWKVFGPEILFESWPGEKIKLSELSNIGAIKLPGDHNKARLWLMESLKNSWEMDVDEHILNQLDIPHEVRPVQRSFQKLPKSLHSRFIEFSKQGRNLVIWGAGKAGCLCLAELRREGIHPDAFLDRDETKRGGELQGLPIRSIQELDQCQLRPFIVVASMYASEIISELNERGFAPLDDYISYNPGLPAASDKSESGEHSPKLLGMTTPEEQKYIFHYARDSYDGSGAIVDLGCWLGSTTIPLAQGLKAAGFNTSVDAYDLFVWYEWMDRYAGELEGRYAPGDSFLPEFQRRLGSLNSRVNIQAGDLTKIGWNGSPISFLLIDAMKSWDLCSAINRNFLPFVMERKGLVMHQDFKFWGCPWIHLSMFRLRDCFEIEQDLSNSPGTVFRLIHSPALDGLEKPLRETDVSAEEVEEAYAFWNRHISGPYAYLLDWARLLVLSQIGERKRALAGLDGLFESGCYLDDLFLDALRPHLPDIRYLKPGEPWQTSLSRAVEAHKPICMWGAGSFGRNVLQKHPFLLNQLQYVIDSDPQKIGLFTENVPIVSPDELTKAQSLPFVVVTTSFISEITTHLWQLGYVKGRDYCVADYRK
jgi:predicted O-methyltransferase YrrM